MTSRRRVAFLLALGMAVLPACGGGGPELAPCTDPAPTARNTPELPPGFPTPDGVEYTGSEQAGPSTIVEGFASADLEATFQAYLKAFPEAGYDVLDEEKEARDAEVNFSGGGTSGQVRLLQRCAGRTSISMTIRPVA